MAYTEKDLVEDYRFINRLRFRDGSGVNLVSLQEALQDECDANGIPVAFRSDILKTGGLLNKQTEEVLVLYNTEHPKDYLQFMIRVTHQGRYAFLDVFKVGGSKNFARNYRATGGLGTGAAVVQGAFNLLSGHKQKLQEEENFYTILTDCFESVVA